MIAIKTLGLTKKYKDLVAVDNINLEVFEGEIFSLLGINGAGKTTTIKMLSCLTKQTSGEAFLKDKSITKEALEVKKIIAVSPQETAVAKGLTVKENLELICGIYGFSKDKKYKKIEEIEEKLGLKEVENKKAGKLSGGFMRRLSIAMSLISEPEILFLDEPTLGLDVISRSELWSLINALKGKITIILTTHYMEEAEALSDRIAIMKDGRILEVDTPSKIKEKANAETIEQAFIKIVKGEA